MSKNELNTKIMIAKHLGYSKETITKLKAAKTSIEADNIMKAARDKIK